MTTDLTKLLNDLCAASRAVGTRVHVTGDERREAAARAALFAELDSYRSTVEALDREIADLRNDQEIWKATLSQLQRERAGHDREIARLKSLHEMQDASERFWFAEAAAQSRRANRVEARLARVLRWAWTFGAPWWWGQSGPYRAKPSTMRRDGEGWMVRRGQAWSRCHVKEREP